MTGQIEANAEEAVEEVPLSPAEASALLRQQGTETLKRAYRRMTGMMWFYRLAALAYVLVTLFAVLALARPEVPARAGVQVVVMTTLMAVLLVMAALQVLFRPLVWNGILAGLATAVAVFHLVGPNPLGIAFPGSVALAVLLWAALVPTQRIQKLIADHKDAYIMHHASVNTRRSLKGRTPEQRHERLLAVMERASQRAWVQSVVASAAIVIASGVGTNWFLSGVRRPDLSAAVAELEAAWNASDLPTVGECYDERVRAQESAWLEGVVDGHGWSARLPRLDDGRTNEEAAKATVDYELGHIPMSTSWALADKRWSLVRIELPVPPFEPILARFVEAWGTSDPAAIAAFFSSESQAKMRQSIKKAALARAWSEYPGFLDTHAGDYSKGETTVSFILTKGELTTKWTLGPDGKWRLYELGFPKR